MVNLLCGASILHHSGGLHKTWDSLRGPAGCAGFFRQAPETVNPGRKHQFIRWLRLHQGYTGGSRRIYRICREHHLTIRSQHRPNGLTKADRQAEKSENLIQRDFTAEKPNQKFLTDITEIPCADGKLYLAAVLDCFDGSIQGFHMDDNMRAELCVRALEQACRNGGTEGAILHSDRGSQFTSQPFRAALARHKLVQSMSGTGRCYDNARMESFFATLKKEKLYNTNTARLSRERVKSIVFRYIHYYNLRRISSVTGGLPPLVFRRNFFAAIPHQQEFDRQLPIILYSYVQERKESNLQKALDAAMKMKAS